MPRKNGVNRRQFISRSLTGAVAAGLTAGHSLGATGGTDEEIPRIRQYRVLGRTGFKASDIGTGGPTDPNILRAVLDAGVTYIDTAESYGRGNSERIVGDVLKGRDRQKFFITTKLHLEQKPGKQEILDRFGRCLERMKTDYADCLMIHGAPSTEYVKLESFHAAVRQLKADGKLRFAGISNHGPRDRETYEPMDTVLLAAAEDGRFDVMLLVYNFVQREQGERVLQACREKNIGATLMKTNPVGKYLGVQEDIREMEKEGQSVPDNYRRALDRYQAEMDRAEAFLKAGNLREPGEIRDAAIRFVLKNEAVSSVCIRFNNFDLVDAHLRLSGSVLTGKDEKKLSLFRDRCSRLYCRHACGQCEAVCPNGVPVNTIMRYDHYFQAQQREKEAMAKYAALPGQRAGACRDCAGECQRACPHGVPIQAMLDLAHRRLTLV
jgi:predicted aldo/keto reductase-like oxidoreductase